MTTRQLLNKLKHLDKKINIAIIGIGSMGKGLLYQSLITPGFRCVGIADIDINRAISCAQELGCDYRVVDSLDCLHRAVREGRMAVCADGDLLARCELVDALVESSNSIIPAAQFAVTALQH